MGPKLTRRDFRPDPPGVPLSRLRELIARFVELKLQISHAQLDPAPWRLRQLVDEAAGYGRFLERCRYEAEEQPTRGGR
jgi:hypothetical protein